MEPLIYFLLFSVGFNLFLFLIAFLFQTDKITDLSYSLTFIVLAAYSLFTSRMNATDVILFIMVAIWAIRLGSYLVFRVLSMGRDSRFDDIRVRFISFFLFWLMQGITCFIVMVPVLLAHQVGDKPFSILFIMGCILAIFGFGIEAIADQQKFNFKKHNPDIHFKTGLYSIVQHPNYTGELLFWWGIFLATTTYIPWYLGIIGPIWISFIIIKFSGISILQKKWKSNYGQNPDFLEYQAKTNKLIPFLY